MGSSKYGFGRRREGEWEHGIKGDEAKIATEKPMASCFGTPNRLFKPDQRATYFGSEPAASEGGYS